MTATSPSRALLLGLATALSGGIALLGLTVPGSPGVASPLERPVPATALQQARAVPAAPAAPAPRAESTARPVVAAPAPAAPAPPAALRDLLRRQEAAGLDCALSARQLPVCVHGDDPEPDASAGSVDMAHGPASTTTGTSGSIGCYGDGTSGPRVRAVYARPQSAPDRYAASVGSIRGWAAGVSRQFDSSAARTNGRRHVRFATSGGASCTVTVLNVTLPDHAFVSFTATINALQSRGLDAPGSKYLVWADATGYCGVATTYADDKPGLDNINNGSFPSYARVDRRCWGKAETHEVVHMLGGIQRSAPNSTDGWHCSDGTDPMCYADGTARSAQREVCGNGNAGLLDCRNDDYFSTSAPRGSYLQTHWNTARSSFLSAVLSEARTSSSPAPAPPAAASPSPTSAPPAGGSLLPGLPLPTGAPVLPLLSAAR